MIRFSLPKAAALVILASAIPAHSAVTVMGNTTARSCYEAALMERVSRSSIRTCDQALSGGQLVGRDRVATHVNRGILYVNLGDFQAGIADYDTAIQLDESEPEAYLNKALAMLRRDRAGTAALPLFNRAIELGTREPAIAHYGRSVAHELSGDIEAAYRDMQRASELDPDWELPQRDLGRFMVVDGD